MKRKHPFQRTAALDAPSRALPRSCARCAHRGRIAFVVVLLTCVQCISPRRADAQSTLPSISPQTSAATTFKSGDARKILNLLADTDGDRGPEAASELRRLGFDDSAVSLGRAIPNLDPSRRAEFARSLAGNVQQGRLPVLRLLTFDPNDGVRAAALEALRDAPPDPALRERVRHMSEADDSSLVRGYARLLAADWGEDASALRFSPGQPAEPATQPDQPSRRPAPNTKPPAEFQAMPRSRGDGWASSSRLPQVSSRPVRKRPSQPAELPDSSPFRRGDFDISPEAIFAADEFTDPATLSREHGVRPASSTSEIELPLPREPDPDPPPTAVGPPFPGNDPLNGSSITGDAQPDDDTQPVEPLFKDDVQPELLRDPVPQPTGDGLAPVDELFDESGVLLAGAPGMLLDWDTGAPLGYAGPSGVLPTAGQENDHFVPVEDRWRVGFPEWDRYNKGHPPVDDYPYVEGQQFDPFNQNVLKGDYPVIGQHTFLNLTGTSKMLHEFKELPTATTPFESTKDPFQEEFFGDPFQYLYSHFFSLRMDLFHGNAAFKPVDWLVRITPVFNMNYLDTNELAVVNPDVRDGTTRFRTDFALEEWFAEAKIADLGPAYDFASIRAGSQFFNSDFRGFIFSDTNRAVRLFGTRLSNRDQFNIAYFDQAEKETNSTLNTFDDRHQNVFIANYYRQDFIFPGYTAQASFHYDHDKGSMIFDKNDVLVRPDPAGVFQKHTVDAYYMGFTGDGHVGRYNLNNAFYWVLGQDDFNPIASRSQEIDAKMAAVELSYDRDWARFRTSYFYASGDPDANDNDAEGFDAIFDNPNFAGGEFTYWQRQAIRLFGVNLTNRQSLVPNLRSSKIEGQVNFVNPGLHLINAGMDFDVTPKLKLINNVNFLWFDTTRVLETFTFQDKIDSRIGTDLSMGIEYRPLLNDNIQIIAGLSCLIPGAGFDDLFGEVGSKATLKKAVKIDADTMYSHFVEMILIF